MLTKILTQQINLSKTEIKILLFYNGKYYLWVTRYTLDKVCAKKCVVKLQVRCFSSLHWLSKSSSNKIGMNLLYQK